jgi:hypothetical protein
MSSTWKKTRIMNTSMLRSFLAVGLVAASMTFATPALASEPEDVDATPIVQVGDLTNGESTTIPAAEVAQAREAEAAEATIPLGEAEAITNDLLELSDEQGVYAKENHVDVIPLMDGDAVLAVPTDTVVESVHVAVSEEGSISTSVQTAAESTQDVDLSGPQMAASWSANGSGSYVLKLYADPLCCARTLLADGRFTWKRWKMLGDGDANADHFLYKRFGDVQPASLPNTPDARTEILRIQSFPYDSVEPNLRSWNRYSPASDRSDTCNSYSASFSFKGLSVSTPFDARCGKYNMWRNVDKPSSYWLQYEGGGGGNREVGYILSWSQKPGTAASMHDVNKIKISFPLPSGRPDQTCTQTDASRTCTT